MGLNVVRLLRTWLLRPANEQSGWRILTAYLDETGSEARGLVIVAGFIGDITAWQKLATDWPKAFERSKQKRLHLGPCPFSLSRPCVPEVSKAELGLSPKLGETRKLVCIGGRSRWWPRIRHQAVGDTLSGD